MKKNGLCVTILSHFCIIPLKHGGFDAGVQERQGRDGGTLASTKGNILAMNSVNVVHKNSGGTTRSMKIEPTTFRGQRKKKDTYSRKQKRGQTVCAKYGK